MKKYEVEWTPADTFGVDKDINSIISRRQKKGWEFVPPIISTSDYAGNATTCSGKLILTFVKNEDD